MLCRSGPVFRPTTAKPPVLQEEERLLICRHCKWIATPGRPSYQEAGLKLVPTYTRQLLTEKLCTFLKLEIVNANFALHPQACLGPRLQHEENGS